MEEAGLLGRYWKLIRRIFSLNILIKQINRNSLIKRYFLAALIASRYVERALFA